MISCQVLTAEMSKRERRRGRRGGGGGGGRATAWGGSERQARGRCLDGNQAYHKQEVEVCGWRPQLLCLAAELLLLLLLLLNQSRVTRTTNSFNVLTPENSPFTLSELSHRRSVWSGLVLFVSTPTGVLLFFMELFPRISACASLRGLCCLSG